MSKNASYMRGLRWGRGDKVKIRQDLGVIYSDPKDNNRTRMSFQIRKEMEKLNPELWLDI